MQKLFKLFMMGMLIPLLSLFSCSDEFLDAPSENQLTPGDLPEGITAFDIAQDEEKREEFYENIAV